MASPESLTLWESVLERIETDLAAAAAGGEVPRWDAPTGMPPLPEELRERTRRLLAAQADLLERAHDTKADLGRRLAALNALRPLAATTTAKPVYIDAIS
ncbi:hypothetical protein [Gryllotalpicola sp.]|uniref:hypothetical protein n=1 Tax=Gryllotalpicola sp. TaxID=1932787 RepID=UPI00260AA8A7|nr:hypothetical protein [Gryllotalpicola sp.]